MRTRAWAAWALAGGVLAGCGPRGSYQGRAVWSITQGGQTQNLEQVEVRELMPGSGSDVVVVSADCDLPANVSGSALTMLPTTCIVWRDGEELELTFTGTGMLGGGDRLGLTLEGPMTVTRDGVAQPGQFSLAFDGQRL